MKKYDLSKIMRRAWELVKKSDMTISSGLKKAWEEAYNFIMEFEFDTDTKGHGYFYAVETR